MGDGRRYIMFVFSGRGEGGDTEIRRGMKCWVV